MNDIIIIGAGVVGASIARELSKYKLNTLVLEKNNEVSNEASKGNTAIVHAGYDPIENTLMAKLNVEGNALYDDLANELGFPFIRNKSIIIATNEEEKNILETLLKRAINNNVPNIRIINREEILEIEPNIADGVKWALLAETGAIVSPWQLTENLCENAKDNGVIFKLSETVENITKENDIFTVKTNKEIYQSKIVINCAGVNADDIHNMICKKEFEITPVKGEYLVYPHFEGSKVNTSIFQVPTSAGKGVLVTPTAHGHLIIGPTADPMNNKENKDTTKETFDKLIEKSKKSIKNIDYKQPIREYAGIRANSDQKDFFIKENSDIKGFIDVACIKSPGLTAAPAIAKYVIEILKNTNKLEMIEDENFNPFRRKQKVLYTYPNDKRDEVIKDDSNFGEYIDRHENITKGDILDIINRNIGATTLNGVKRRTRCGASESQMIFTMPKVLDILSTALNKDITEIMLEDNGSYVLTEKSKFNKNKLKLEYTKFDFNCLENEYETIIIGAGIKGLKEANRRANLGETVLIIDSLDEIGGVEYELLSLQSAINEKVDTSKINSLIDNRIKYLVNTSVFECNPTNNIIDLISKKGYKRIKYKNLVLALGKYEANRENLKIPGSRPSGIFTAMQGVRILNYNSYLFGKEIVIYGIKNETLKLIERLEKENVNIKAIVINHELSNEQKEKLSKYKIITSNINEIKGYPRLEAVSLDNDMIIDCDTLIISQYYIPENVLTKKMKLKLDDNDNVIVDKNNKTNIENIYSI